MSDGNIVLLLFFKESVAEPVVEKTVSCRVYVLFCNHHTDQPVQGSTKYFNINKNNQISFTLSERVCLHVTKHGGNKQEEHKA